MGIAGENNIRVQLVKGQGETNDRLEALIKEQQITNQWLARIAQLLEAQQQSAQAQYPAAGVPQHGGW